VVKGNVWKVVGLFTEKISIFGGSGISRHGIKKFKNRELDSVSVKRIISKSINFIKKSESKKSRYHTLENLKSK
jgi:hypothetical protein